MFDNMCDMFIDKVYTSELKTKIHYLAKAFEELCAKTPNEDSDDSDLHFCYTEMREVAETLLLLFPEY